MNDLQKTELEILTKALKLLNEIADKSNMDINEKTAIIYLLDVLSTNMLNNEEYEKYMGENTMLINPVERYCIEKGREEGREEGREKGREDTQIFIARNMLNEGFDIDVILKLTGLSKEEFENI